MKLYVYDGAVLRFEDVIERRWHAETYAESSAKARSNLTYRYKKDHGYAANAKIILPGTMNIYPIKDDEVDG